MSFPRVEESLVLFQEPKLVTSTISQLSRSQHLEQISLLLEALRAARGTVNQVHRNAAQVAAARSAHWRQALRGYALEGRSVAAALAAPWRRGAAVLCAAASEGLRKDTVLLAIFVGMGKAMKSNEKQ